MWYLKYGRWDIKVDYQGVKNTQTELLVNISSIDKIIKERIQQTEKSASETLKRIKNKYSSNEINYQRMNEETKKTNQETNELINEFFNISYSFHDLYNYSFDHNDKRKQDNLMENLLSEFELDLQNKEDRAIADMIAKIKRDYNRVKQQVITIPEKTKILAMFSKIDKGSKNKNVIFDNLCSYYSARVEYNRQCSTSSGKIVFLQDMDVVAKELFYEADLKASYVLREDSSKLIVPELETQKKLDMLNKYEQLVKDGKIEKSVKNVNIEMIKGSLSEMATYEKRIASVEKCIEILSSDEKANEFSNIISKLSKLRGKLVSKHEILNKKFKSLNFKYVEEKVSLVELREKKNKAIREYADNYQKLLAGIDTLSTEEVQLVNDNLSKIVEVEGLDESDIEEARSIGKEAYIKKVGEEAQKEYNRRKQEDVALEEQKIYEEISKQVAEDNKYIPSSSIMAGYTPTSGDDAAREYNERVEARNDRETLERFRQELNKIDKPNKKR